MESGRLSVGDRVVVPNRYEVRVATTDLRALGDLTYSLELELADAVLRFARAHQYTVSDRPLVRLTADRTVARGDARVAASFAGEAIRGQPTGSGAGNAAGGGVRTGDPRGADAHPPGDLGPRIRADGRPRGGPALPLGPVADATRTMVFEVPTVDAPLAVLREIAPDGRERHLTLDGAPVTLGRAPENTVVLDDARVSRFHGRLQAQQGALVYRDLDSTNGSRVNGVEVDEVVLGAGDRIELGDTLLIVESTPVSG